MSILMIILLVLGLLLVVAAFTGFKQHLDKLINDKKIGQKNPVATAKKINLTLGFLFINLYGAYLINYAWIILVIVFSILIFGIMVVKGMGSVKTFAVNLKWSVYISLTLFVIVLALLTYALTSPDYEIEDGSFKINTLHGTELPLNQIKAIKKNDKMTRILQPHKGIHIGAYYRGTFELDFLGRGKVYVKDGSKPYIYIYLDKKAYIINAGNAQDTEHLYDKLREAWIDQLKRSSSK
ncbi:MAG: hypothetical protein GF313_07195 [Caldithrix sp.]|nr:hypothetical protein [Caldithrix sp.]